MALTDNLTSRTAGRIVRLIDERVAPFLGGGGPRAVIGKFKGEDRTYEASEEMLKKLTKGATDKNWNRSSAEPRKRRVRHSASGENSR